MVFMGIFLSSGAPASVAVDHCQKACTADAAGCGQADEDDDGGPHHDDCPGMPHHHHSDGCVHSATSAWLVEWGNVSLPGSCSECGSLETGNEHPPDDPVFVLDKPPLI